MTEMKVDQEDLAIIKITTEQTPDGSLTSFEWVGGGRVVAVSGELMRDMDDPGFVFPWEMERVGHNTVEDIVYYRIRGLN